MTQAKKETVDQPNDDIVLRDVRVCFPQIWEKKSVMGSEPRYSATFLIDPVQNADALKALAEGIDYLVDTDKKLDGVRPKAKLCLKDGDALNADARDEGKREYDEFAGQMVLRTAQTRSLLVFDENNKKLEFGVDGEDCYGGMVVTALVDLYAWAFQGSKGISASLSAIKLVRDGERFGGAGRSEESVIAAFGDDDDSAPF